MKVSVSLSDEDIAVLDAYMKSSGLASRSAAVQHAVRLLRHPQLQEDYAVAWAEWQESGERTAWDSTAGDGLSDAPR